MQPSLSSVARHLLHRNITIDYCKNKVGHRGTDLMVFLEPGFPSGLIGIIKFLIGLG